MKKIVTAIVFFCGLALASAQTPYSKEVNEQIKLVENSLSGRFKVNGKANNILDRMAFFKVNGLSIAVVHNYKVVWAKGYGWADVNEKRPVTASTLFKPGSISKSLNAVGVLKLAQDNKLDIYDDINKYLKSWKFPYDSLSKGKKITSANLLSHTAGLSVYGGFPGYNVNSKIPTIPQILDGAEPANTPSVRSLFEPGLQFQYSGGGTIISQLIITDLTNQSYEKFMLDSVLKPMGMKNSFYSAAPPSKNEMNKYSMGYTSEGARAEATFHIYPEQAPMGLWTTPTDLCKYIIETQLAYEGKSSKVLNQEMTKLRLTPYIDQSSALGVFIDNRNGVKYFQHDAANEGFKGVYLGSMEGGNGVAIVVNSDNGNIIPELLNSVAGVYNWNGFDKPSSITTWKINDTLLQKYAGVYLYDGLIADVSIKPDGLYFWTSGLDAKMYFTSDKDFINMEFQAEKSFLSDGQGNITGYARKVNGKEYAPAMKVNRVDTIMAMDGQLNNFGWHLLETKRYNEAITFLSRGIELEPNDIPAFGNLAHCFLFTNEYEKAIQMYNVFLAKKPDEAAYFKSTIKQDFDYFRGKGFDKALMDKATADLHL
jgi:CubicO group peptidase (beta-lactamase class C family)